MFSCDYCIFQQGVCPRLKLSLCLLSVVIVFINQSEGFLPSQYIGCFEELQPDSARVMNVPAFSGDNPGNIDICIARCGSLHYTYSANQAGSECWCGDKYNNVTSTGCTYSCQGSGSSNYICGGGWNNSIYSVCPPGQFNWTASGCTRDCGQCICRETTGICLTQCNKGWNGDSCTQDIDECSSKLQNNCTQHCNNLPGSYNCSCWNGFTLQNDSITCNDTDECLNKTLSGCEVGCDNTAGGFNCTCLPGYELDDNKKTCHDINECSYKDICEQNCTNTNGSYICYCRNGLKDATCNDTVVVGTEMMKLIPLVPAIVVPVSFCIIVIIVVVVILIRKKRQKHTSDGETHATSVLQSSRGGTLDAPAKQKIMKELTTNMASPDYYNLGELSHVIKVADLPSRYQTIKANKDVLSKEFKSIPEVTAGEDTSFGKPAALKTKNRFKNIRPYNRNRVNLAEINNDPLSSYINASFIEGYDTEKKIIAAQGPTKSSVNDFWRMIWQYDATVIFMFTHLVENGKTKCHQYWPAGDVESFGDISVEMRSVEESGDHIIRPLVVSKKGIQRHIKHIQFTEWPDHGVPEDALPLLCFRQKTRRFIEEGKYVVYHCSAGVGRTGTYLAIDYLLSVAEETGEVDVHRCVKKLREQRMNCVQTMPQYTFIYQAVSEGVIVGDSLIPASDLTERYAALHRINDVTGKTVIQTEFDLLAGSNISQRVESNKVLINNHHRVVPKTKVKGKHELINAVYIQGYKVKGCYIAMQLSSQPTAASQLWNMCMDYNCRTVLVLMNDHLNQEEFTILQPGETVQQGSLSIKTVSREISEKLSSCQVCIVSIGNKGVDNVVYENTEAITTSITVILATFQVEAESHAERLVAVNQLVRPLYQRHTKSGPLVVVARDEMKLCGLYISVANICEMMRAEKQVDVIHTVLNVRHALPHFLTDQNEYEQLYLAASLSTQQSTEDIPIIYEHIPQ